MDFLTLALFFMLVIRFFMAIEPFSPWRIYLRESKTPLERVIAITVMIPILGEVILLLLGIFRVFNWIFEHAGEDE